MANTDDDRTLDAWNRLQDRAEAMVPLIGRLYRRNGILTKVYGRLLRDKSPLELINIHRGAREVTGADLTVHDTYPILEALDAMDMRGLMRIDIGKLAVKYHAQAERTSVDEFLRGQLTGLLDGGQARPERPQDVVLYGFGRIGRLLARILMEKTGGGAGLRLRAIVVRPGGDLEKRASLLRVDSIHGPFHGSIEVDEAAGCLLINGNRIKVIEAKQPEDINYNDHGIDEAIVIDNTGAWRDREGLSRHLQATGAAKVILTAPGKGDVPNIVYGINHADIAEGERVLSAASCTTNAITPVLKVVDDAYGIQHGHIETCHSYTNDQNLIDNYHSKPRRGRGAPLNMVITETGAAKAVTKALPGLAGKLTGNAIRVPTPNVSLAVLALRLEKPVDLAGLNEKLRQESLDGALQLQIDYSNSPDAVSSDFVGNGHACIVDSLATIVSEDQVVLYAWYDNEFGYSRQVMRLVERVSGLRPPVFP